MTPSEKNRSVFLAVEGRRRDRLRRFRRRARRTTGTDEPAGSPAPCSIPISMAAWELASGLLSRTSGRTKLPVTTAAIATATRPPFQDVQNGGRSRGGRAGAAPRAARRAALIFLALTAGTSSFEDAIREAGRDNGARWVAKRRSGGRRPRPPHPASRHPGRFWKPGAVSELPVSARAMKSTPKPAKTMTPNSFTAPIRFERTADTEGQTSGP